jgi:DHA1 family multidrug/chloramphenicol efflux transport protein-like MFS transporter
MARLLMTISRKQAFVYAFFLVLYEFLTYIANDMIMPGMINVVASFHAPESAIATSLTAYVFGGASLQLLLGPLSDHYGRRPIMISGAIFFFICTVLIACTTSIDQFLIARFFQGMGLCFISVIGYATLHEIFSEMDAIRLIAIMANVSITAPLLGPLLGAVFISFYSWRFIFVIISLFALIAAWGIWRCMPETVGNTNKKDKQPNELLSLKTILSNYKTLLGHPRFLIGSIALGILYLPCMAWIGLAPVILITAGKLSVMQYALWQLPIFSAYILGNIGLHKMTHHKTLPQIILIGSSIAVCSLFLVFGLALYLGSSFEWLMPGMICYFLGAGIIAAPLSRFTLFSTSVSKGTASALLSMIGMSIQAMGIEIANCVYSTHNNSYFGFYCLIVGITYSIFLYFLRASKQ